MLDPNILLIITCCATAHFVMAAVMALYARHKVQYLALTWIMGIFAAVLVLLSFAYKHLMSSPGMLSPYHLLSIPGIIFLQSIYPLSIPMPAYLQWGRMLRYALPSIVLYVLYGGAILLGHEPIRLDHSSDIGQHIFCLDLWLRVAAFVLCIYYLINILRLPTKEAHKATLPRYLKGYCLVLSLSVALYLANAIWYTPELMLGYIILFTLLNLYLCFRTLETMANKLPKPTIEKVEKEPTPEVIAKAEQEDFNEANLQRFQRVEFWMQNNRDKWTQSTFNRDMLCEEVGLNRHLLLQCVRSQGYNDTHEYLNTYRIEELKRMIQRGMVHTVSESLDAGFGTPKTARSVFVKMTGTTLDDYLAAHKKQH